jgi:preprotein translocase subunit SecE
MYLINKDKNELEEISSATFKNLGVSERNNLQEWLAKSPKIFGEEMLIIQKEFDGFNDTNERLDLLALDKQGNLVIIENKLDDSGRDVVWQVLKYASYCSSLNNQNIKDIFDQYLKKEGREGTAEDLLADFFGDEDYQDKINNGNSQRIIMVAGKFRKEVTSTVLWLLNYGLRIQCFKVSAYKHKEESLLNLEQIIPMKDAEDYIISMASKNLEDLSNQEDVKNRHSKRFEFWSQFLKEINKVNHLCANLSPGNDSWIGCALGMSGVGLNLVITQKYARAEVYINRGSSEENKKIFDYFYKLKEEIEKEFGEALVWERKEDKIVSRIKYQLDGVNAFDKEDWGKINKFLIDAAVRMEKVFSAYVRKLKSDMSR